MASSTPVRVELTRTQRDAIYEEVESAFGYSVDLRISFNKRSSDERDWIVETLERMATAVRLLDALGWEEHGERDSYELEVDEEIVRFMERLQAHCIDALRDDARGVSNDEKDAAERANRRLLIDQDLDGIDAAHLALKAYREAA